MDAGRREATPYPLEQHFFGVCPTEFFDQVYNSCDDYVEAGVDAIENQLKEELDQTFHPLIRTCCDKMMTDYQKVFDHNMDKFEMYALRNIFEVTPAVYAEWSRASRRKSIPLVEEKDVAGLSDAEEAALREKLVDARRRLKVAKRKQQRLNSQLVRLQGRRGSLEEEVGRIESAYSQSVVAAGVAPVKRTSEQLVQNQVKLKELCAKARGLTGASDPGSDLEAAMAQAGAHSSTFLGQLPRSSAPAAAARAVRSAVSTRDVGDLRALSKAMGGAGYNSAGH